MNLLLVLFLCIGIAAAWWNLGEPYSGINFEDSGAISVLEKNRAVPKKVARLASSSIYYSNARAAERIERSGAITDSDLPEQCRGQNYCTVKRNNYPEDQFNEMFKDYKAPAESLQPVQTQTHASLESRKATFEVVDNCQTVISYEPLYHTRDRTGDWRDVVQAPKAGLFQKVRLETCLNEGASCFTAFEMQDEFQTFCRQKYNTWEVLVSDGKNGTEKLKTELPVCCSCHYKPVE